MTHANMLAQTLVDRLGWTLLHSLWELAAVAILLAVVLRILRGRPATARHMACLFAMTAIVAVPTVTFILLKPSPRPVTTATTPLATNTVLTELVPPPISIEAAQMPAPPSTAAPLTVEKPTWRERLSSLLRPSVAAWLFGVAGLSLWHLGGAYALRRLRKLGTTPPAAALLDRLERLRRRLDISRPVMLLESSLVHTPTLIGWLRPVILLPTSLASGLSTAQLEAILAHELAHVARHDYLINLLQTVAEIAFFYHPAVWWASRRLRIEREHCCDDDAIAACGDRVLYAKALAAAEESRAFLAPERLALAATGPDATSLLSRIRRILRPSSDDVPSRAWTTLPLIGLLTAALLLAVLARTPVKAQAAPPPAEPHRLTITVIDAVTEKPLPDTVVQWRTNTPHPETTDEAGRCSFTIPPDKMQSVSLRAARPKYVGRIVAWANGTPVPNAYTIKLEPAIPIGGVVHDEDGKPVASATVRIQNYFTRSDPRGVRDVRNVDGNARTDADGRWSIDNAPADMADLSVEVTHPDFLPGRTTAANRLQPEKLKDKAAVYTLLKGAVVTGKILGPDGQPVARAVVSYDFTTRTDHPKATTDADGNFRLDRVRPGPADLRVDGPGVATRIEQVIVEKPQTAVQIQMKKGNRIAGQVLGPDGQPVAGARVEARQWLGNYVEGWWKANTGPDGRFEWDGAPDEAVTFWVIAKGLANPGDVRLKPQADDHVVKLYRQLRVTGTVVDEETGAPIEEFEVTFGAGDRRPQGAPFWLPDSTRRFHAGRFEASPDGPRQQHFIRVSAANYLPSISRPVADNEQDIALDFKLKRGKPIEATVLNAAGKPVRGAEVFLATASTQVMLQNGRRSSSQNFSPETKTDAGGGFTFPPEAQEFRVVIIHDDGFADAGPAALATGKVTLEPWARVEGVVMRGNKPLPGDTVGMYLDRSEPGGTIRVHEMYQVSADDSGRFAFDRVVPGSGMAARYIEIRPMTWGYSNGARFDVQPGKTAAVQIGGVGRPVVARVTSPAGVAWQHADAMLHARPPEAPADIVPANWRAMTIEQRREWVKSDAGAAYRAHRALAGRVIRGTLDQAGAFRADDVPDGQYDLTISLYAPTPAAAHFGDRRPVALLRTTVTVPPIPGGRSDDPLDLGTVEATVPPPAPQGRP